MDDTYERKVTASDFQRMNEDTHRQYRRERELRPTDLKADVFARAFVAHDSSVPLAAEKTAMLTDDFKAA